MTHLANHLAPGTTPVILLYPQTKDTVTTAQSDTVQLLTYTVDSTMPTDWVTYTMTSTWAPLFVDGTYNTDSTWLDDKWNPVSPSELPRGGIADTRVDKEKDPVPYNSDLPYPQGKTN